MGFLDEYNKALEEEKKKKKKNTSSTTTKKTSSFMDTYRSSLAGMTQVAEDDIAPILPTVTTRSTKKDKRKWFEKGAFEDGYQFGDVTKTILGSATDVLENIGSGIMGMGETALDAFAYLGNAAAKGQYYQNSGGFNIEQDKLFEEQHEKATKATETFIKKDLYDEEAVAKAIISDPMKALTGIDAEEDSVFGEKTDSLVQSGGQLLATAGLQAVGVPWFLTTGATAFGSEAENALNQGASFEEAGLSATISAGAEILTEKLSGGIKFGGKAADDALSSVIAANISNKLTQKLAKLGLDMAGEGAEEVISQFASNLGSALYKEDDLSEILFSEEAFDGYLESFIGGAALGGFGNVVQSVKADRLGVNSVTELNTNEQAVVDKVYNDRLAEAEKNGKLSAKEKTKLYDQVMNDLDKGYISTEDIESAVSGDAYKSWQQQTDWQNHLQQEIEKLENMPNAEITVKQSERLKHLREELADHQKKYDTKNFKSILSEKTANLVKDTRLAESYNEKARRGQAFEADLSQYDEKQQKVIQKAIDSGILNNTNRTHEFVDIVSKISADKGVLFDFTNNAKLKESGFAVDGKTVNGFVTKDGVTLNIDSPKAWQSTVGHEITHVLEGTEMYDALKNTIFEYAKSKGEYDSRLSKLTETYKGVDADIEAELAADLVGDYLFQDADFINHLSTQNRNVFQKIYDEIKYLYKVVTAGSKEARELEKVKRAFDKAYRESAKAQTEEAAETKYSLVEDQKTIDFLENQEYMTVYKAMAQIDGKLYPPMSSQEYVDEEVTLKNGKKKTKRVRKLKNPSVLGRWQQSDERPDLIQKFQPPSAKYPDGYGKFDLLKSNGKTTKDVAYNPYEHTSNIVLNDQFAEAYQRPELVTVEYHIPVSELTSGYKAKYAKDAVGLTDWKAGGVAQQLKNSHRDVYLTRWSKPVRVLSDAEVAQKYKDILDKEDGISVPWNVVTPSLRMELEKAGVPIDYSVVTSGKTFEQAEGERHKAAKYSLSDSDGKQLTQEQQEFFKDSKMRDENGNLKVMYHGSQDAGFHVFDASKSDDNTSFFFVDRNDAAASYSGTSETYEAKTIRSAEDMNNFLAEIGYDQYEAVEKNGKFELLENNEHVAWSDTAQGIYEEFCWYEGVGEGDANYKVYLNLTNPLVVDAEGRNWDNVSQEFWPELYEQWKTDFTPEEKAALIDLAGWEDFSTFKAEVERAVRDAGKPTADEYTKAIDSAYWKNSDISSLSSMAADNFSDEVLKAEAIKQMTTRDYAQKAKEQGYDGVIFKNIVDIGAYGGDYRNPATVAVAFNSNQIKSVANATPTKDADIRYSLSEDSEGRKLTENQSAYFNGSKVVDGNGNLKVVYHGSGAEFTEFSYAYMSTHGSMEGQGFYFTDNKTMAEGYQKNGAKLMQGYLDIKKPLSDSKVTLKRSELTKLIKAIDPTGDDVVLNYDPMGGKGYPSRAWYNRSLSATVDAIYNSSDSDSEILADLANSGAGTEMVVRKAREVLGYDGYIVDDKYDNTTVYVAFESNQFKNVDNLNPTTDPDIRRSLSEEGEQFKRYGSFATPAKDLRLDIAPVAENATVQEKTQLTEENATPNSTVSKTETVISRSPLAEIAKQARRENFRGAYTLDGKQYLGDGSFVAEFNTVDETLEQSAEFPAKRALKELDEAYERQIPGNYDLHTSNSEGYVKVGDFLYDASYVNALIRAIENPVFSLSNVRGGDNALLVSGENGRALLMPVRASDNVNVAYEAQPLDVAPVTEVTEVTDLLPDDLAPAQAELEQLVTERKQLYGALEIAIDRGSANEVGQLAAEYDSLTARIRELENAESERTDSLTDADAPPEMEAPMNIEDAYPGDKSRVADPFADRDWDDAKNLTSIMEERPDLKPFFMEDAMNMLTDYADSQKAELIYNDQVYYDSGGEKGWMGHKRFTSVDIEEILDDWNISWGALERGLQKIANGEAKTAVPKKLEFMINRRLLHGYKDFHTGKWVGPNQAYIEALREYENLQHYEEERNSFFENADDYAPVAEESSVAPEVVISKNETTTPLKAATPDTMDAPIFESKDKTAVKGQTTMFEPPKPNPKVANILAEESAIAKEKSGIGGKLVSALVDKGMVFENLSMKTGNNELQAKYNYALPSNTEARAQYLMEHGDKGVKSLKDIKTRVESTGKADAFYQYMYHVHNIDRMTLEDRFENTPNKPVFGETITADFSRKKVAAYERNNPEFKSMAEDIYRYNAHLRKMLVDNGVISRETAALWQKMYPHYVPIRRVDSKGQNISVPLDTNKTGVNAPIKRATGGSSDITPLFNTMAQRTEQTYRAIARNAFGIELKNTLGSTINAEENTTGVDETIDTLVAQEEKLLKPGTMFSQPTFTVFENGERVEFEITEDMYDALKPAGKILGYRNQAVKAVGDARRNLLTVWNPVFALYRNPIKDIQDVAINSQHAAKTYLNVPNAIYQLATGGEYATEYHQNGGKSNTYFDGRTNKFKAEDNVFKKVIGLPVKAIENAGEFVEEIPRLAEYIASRQEGRSIERSMLDAGRVTTNFAAGGDFTKFLNSHGFTFLNASVQGASQHVRNFREAKQQGLKGWLKVAAKYAVAGLPTILLNGMLWDDDEEYEELSDYVKQNYYVVAKTQDGKFVRIPKGRTAAVMGELFQQMENLVTGDDVADFSTFFDLFMDNIAPNNPIDNNILAPVVQTLSNNAWYGGDIVPSRLQDVPAEEQYDESTDSISKWLGEKTGTSPYKWNYLIDQYSGGLGDVFLPMMTPEAESGDDSLLGNLLAPWKKEMTTDSTLNNKYPGDFYDLRDELEKKANSSKATEEDTMRSMFMDAVSWDMSDLYAQKREIQNSDMSDAEKYEAVREIQEQINALAESAMNGYNDVSVNGLYAEVGDRRFNMDADSGKWYEIQETNADGSANYYYQMEQEVTQALGISPEEYWNNREEYNYAYEKPEQYTLSQAVGGYEAYRGYLSALWDISADKDENGKSFSGSRKEKVIDYLNNLDADYYHKIILFKNEYNADDTYNYEIIDYLNGREDISYEEMETILKYLGFEVDSNGNISW